jgi:CRP-like cAMP-binding protein
MTGSRFLELFLSRRSRLSDGRRRILASVPVRREVHEDGDVIVGAGRVSGRSCLLIRGMTMRRHKTSRGGRVISAINVPGDFMDLHAFVLGELDHDVVAVGRTVVEFVEHRDLEAICRNDPGIMRMLWHETLVEAKAHRAWIVAGASLRAPQRIARLMCEVEARLAEVGLAEGGHFTVPFDQRTLAEVLGYSPVHVNRAVQDLRAGDLLTWTGRSVGLPDGPAIRHYAGFDPGYLELDRQSAPPPAAS